MGSNLPGVPTGASIRAHRKRAGLNTGQYGRLLGVRRGTIENWENERTTPRPRHLVQLTELLAQDPEQIVPPPAAAAPEQRLGLRTCGELIVVNGDHLWLLELKATTCAGAAAFQRRLSNALRREGLRVYRETPQDGEEDEPPGILLSS